MPGILGREGIDIQRITITSEDIYKFSVAIFGQGIQNDLTYSGIGSGFFEIGLGGKQPSTPKSSPSEEISIPDWVRNNAAWFSQDQIDDKTFANGIQFLIKEGIIIVPSTPSGEAKADIAIPDWVKTNAGWWSEGQIDDKTFANGIQFLIKEGIISV